MAVIGQTEGDLIQWLLSHLSDRASGDFSFTIIAWKTTEEASMKLIEVLEQNANKSMDVELVNGNTVTASSWTVGDDFVEANKQQGFSICVSLDKIVSIKVTT